MTSHCDDRCQSSMYVYTIPLGYCNFKCVEVMLPLQQEIVAFIIIDRITCMRYI